MTCARRFADSPPEAPLLATGIRETVRQPLTRNARRVGCMAVRTPTQAPKARGRRCVDPRDQCEAVSTGAFATISAMIPDPQRMNRKTASSTRRKASECCAKRKPARMAPRMLAAHEHDGALHRLPPTQWLMRPMRQGAQRIESPLERLNVALVQKLCASRYHT